MSAAADAGFAAGAAAAPAVTVTEGQWLWQPSASRIARSNLTAYQHWLRERFGVVTDTYEQLWQWSVTAPNAFWASLWEYYDVCHDGRPQVWLDAAWRDPVQTPGAAWCQGARLNYAEHLLRHAEGAGAEAPALLARSELRAPCTLSGAALAEQVRTVATRLRAWGVQPGDRVVSYLPNVPEAAVAMMATLAIGAVWSAAAPEFGVATVVERFAQITPKVLLAVDGYRYGGKDVERREEVQRIAAALPSLEHVVWLPYLHPERAPPVLPGLVVWAPWLAEGAVPAAAAFRYERVAHDHPLWVVYSSGTTGLPKAIVHSHAGMLLEHLKILHLHLDLRPGARMFFYTTTGWMMWNVLIAALLTGASIVLYDGSPQHPASDALWALAAETRVSCLGASPTYVQLMEKAGLQPGRSHDLSALDSVIVSGAPSTPETFAWFYRYVKADLWVTSQSGGTELCSGLVGGVPTLPVYAGEIQARLLGMDVQAYDEHGRAVFDTVGELVVTTPFPSMPLYFWNDTDGRRYFEAYYDVYSQVWRHGDFIKINARGGCYIYGRSDATLNRYGVRIGTAEIYRAVEQVPEVADSLIVCCEQAGGTYFMPLFVRLKPGYVLDTALIERIALRLRRDCSPRHVPDQVYAVDAVPYTLTGKKMEVPVRKLLMGWPLHKAASRDAMLNPEALDYFLGLAATLNA